MNRNALWSLLAVAMFCQFGCSPPPAPSELTDLLRYVYREWDNKDPRALQDAMMRFEDFFNGLDPMDGSQQRSFTLEPFSKEDIQGISPVHDRDPSVCSGIGVAIASEHSTELHGRLQADKDQLPAEPSAKSYKREFLDDTRCFVEQKCEVLRTRNEVVRSNLVMAVEMVLHKDFRWVNIDDERKALVARSWAPESSKAIDDSKAQIHQSYSVDVVVPLKSGLIWRFQGTVTETEGIPDNNSIADMVLRNGTEDGLVAAEKVISERYVEK